MSLSFSRSTITSTKAAASTVMGTFQHHTYHSLASRSSQRRIDGSPRSQNGPVARLSDLQAAEDIFYGAIARASLCKHHARHQATLTRPRTRKVSTSTGRRNVGTVLFGPMLYENEDQNKPAQVVAAEEVSQYELRSLVDVYDSYEDGLRRTRKPREGLKSKIGDNRPKALDVTSRRKKSDEERQQERMPRQVWPAEEAVQELILKLNRLLDDTFVPHNVLFDAYRALPSPRVAYLTDDTIRGLFRHFQVVERKNETTMSRYFCLLDDMTASDIPLKRSDWNSAIAFAGRWVRNVTEQQVENAIQIWLRMEREAHFGADNVTFNILFDIATKAGKFALAELILKEMDDRDMEKNRFFRVGKIYYHGCKLDGEGVRQSYRELVDAGDFVDTAVLNCVVASLIRAGEISAAEQIFARMKRMDARKKGARRAPRGWRGQRDLARLLEKAAQQLRSNPEGRTPIQDATPVTPNLITYRSLIRHHALESGNIDRVTELIRELQEFGHKMHGSIFWLVFMGFSEHGGVRYSSWTKSRLDKWWMVFLGQLEEYREINETENDVADEDRGTYLDKGIVIAVLKAYDSCTEKHSVLQVWEEIQERWKPSERDREAVNETLVSMLPAGLLQTTEPTGLP